MGDRICIEITDQTDCSPTLYCHWAGLRAIKALHDALKESRMEISNVMCNLVIKVMCGECSDKSFYIYNKGECKTAADYDNWFWSFDLHTRLWSTTDPQFEGMKLTIEEAEEYVKGTRPCLYRECPCELYNDPNEPCERRLWDSVYKSKEA